MGDAPLACVGAQLIRNVAPGSAPSMGPYLALWFVYCLVVSACVGSLTWHIAGPGAGPAYVFPHGGANRISGVQDGAAADVDLVPAELGDNFEIVV